VKAAAGRPSDSVADRVKSAAFQRFRRHVTSIERARSIPETDPLAFCMSISWRFCIVQNERGQHALAE
jgi:hypothetical protein